MLFIYLFQKLQIPYNITVLSKAGGIQNYCGCLNPMMFKYCRVTSSSLSPSYQFRPIIYWFHASGTSIHFRHFISTERDLFFSFCVPASDILTLLLQFLARRCHGIAKCSIIRTEPLHLPLSFTSREELCFASIKRGFLFWLWQPKGSYSSDCSLF